MYGFVLRLVLESSSTCTGFVLGLVLESSSTCMGLYWG